MCIRDRPAAQPRLQLAGRAPLLSHQVDISRRAIRHKVRAQNARVRARPWSSMQAGGFVPGPNRFIALALGLYLPLGQAQIVLDGTLGSAGALAGPNFAI